MFALSRSRNSREGHARPSTTQRSIPAEAQETTVLSMRGGVVIASGVSGLDDRASHSCRLCRLVASSRFPAIWVRIDRIQGDQRQNAGIYGSRLFVPTVWMTASSYRVVAVWEMNHPANLVNNPREKSR